MTREGMVRSLFSKKVQWDVLFTTDLAEALNRPAGGYAGKG